MRIALAIPLCAVFTSLGTSCGDAPPPRPSVLLVTLDTTRRDAMGFHGRSPSPTPQLDALAEQSIVFEDAYTVAPLTLPAHASLLTGLYPVSLGVRDNAVLPIPGSAHTLAERFAEAGYSTGAAVAAFVLDRDFGTDQGFERFSAPPRNPGSGEALIAERSAAEMVDVALADLVEMEEPFFYWLHLYDPHYPYTGRRRFNSNPETPEGRWDRYLEELREADRQLGRLFDSLRADGRFDELVVVLASDHGECVGDGRERSHGHFVYDETMRIPLFLRVPTLPPQRVKEQVSLIDIAPTLLSLLDLQEDGPYDGVDLMPLIRGERGSLGDRTLALESYNLYLQHGWAPTEAVVRGPYKYLHSARDALYDRAEDPAESRDRSAEEPELLSELRADLERLFADPEHRLPADPRTQLAAADRARLEQLGYVSSGATQSLTRPEDFASLTDGHDRLEFLRRLDVASINLADSSDPQALANLEELARLAPDSPTVRERLGTYLLRVAPDRLDEAEVHLRAAIDLQIGLPKAHFNLGLCAARRAREWEERADSALGEDKQRALDQAEECRKRAALAYEMALRYEPGHPESLLNLALTRRRFGRQLAAAGEREAAADQLGAALEHLRTFLKVVPETHPDWKRFAPQLDALKAERQRLGAQSPPEGGERP